MDKRQAEILYNNGVTDLPDTYNYIVSQCPIKNTWWDHDEIEYSQKRLLTQFCAIWAGEPFINMDIYDENGNKHPLHHKYIDQVDYLMNSLNNSYPEIKNFIEYFMSLYPIKLTLFTINDEKEELTLLSKIFPESDIKHLAIISHYIKQFNGY